jgi:hypothetical protein
MATVLEGYTAEEQCYFVRFFWAKGLSVKDINKEMFHVYGGKFVVYSGSQLGSKRFADDEEVETEVWKWLRQLLCYGFRRTGKAMGQVYQCWLRICREVNVISWFESHLFYVLYPFVTFY